MEELWKRAISGEKGIQLAFFRLFLHILSFLYLIGFIVFRRIQSFKQIKLPCSVISIGNITLGGTGKTALTALIAERLEAMGYKVSIICTGYGGRNKGKVTRESTKDFGDEACLLARCIKKGGVWAGRDRLRFAKEALKEGANVIILDDAMQYFKIKKDLEIAMLNALAPFGFGYLFPRGALREPLSGLKRADIIIINNSDLSEELEKTLWRVSQINPSAILLKANYLPIRLTTIPTGEEISLLWLKGKRIMGIAGIGSPEGFKKTLERLAEEVIFFSFPDHYPFTKKEVIALQKKAYLNKCDAIVMTDKDGIKVGGLFKEGFPLLVPLLVLSVDLKLSHEEKLWSRIKEILNP